MMRNGITEMASSIDFDLNAKVLDAFVRWIELPKFDQRHAKNWALLFNSDREAAMCEATFWAVLTDCGAQVEPNRDLSGESKSPDFVCHKNGKKFYVEVTCIRIDSAAEETGLDSLSSTDGRAVHYALLNRSIVVECISKTPQCANLDAPCIVAVGTFHHRASVCAVRKLCAEWLVTGETRVAMQFDPKAGKAIGQPYQVTEFEWAAFAGVSQLAGVEPKRQPISAVLIGGLGCDPVNMLGALHPNPIREFDPALLHRIPFCRKAESPYGIEATDWIQAPDDWNMYNQENEPEV